MRGYCERCGKRSTCTELCGPAERYASCDYRPMRERYSPRPDLFDQQTSTAWWRVQEAALTPFPAYDFLRPLENEVLRLFYSEGLSAAQIAVRLKRKRRTVETIAYRAKLKICERLSSAFG